MKWGRHWGTLSGDVSYWGNLSHEIRHDVVFSQGISAQEIADCFESYTPRYILGTRANTILTFPAVTPTTTLTFRNPMIGDVKVLNRQTLVNRNRGGFALLLQDTTWPMFTTMKVKWEAMTKDEAEDFVDFFKDSSAKLIGLLDWYDVQWHGLAIRPTTSVRAGKDDCNMDLELEFIGYKP